MGGGRLRHQLALFVAAGLHTHAYCTDNRHAPAAPGIFIVAQALPPQHLLRLELEAPAAVTATPGLVAGQQEAAMCSRMATALVPRQWLGMRGYGLHRLLTRNYVIYTIRFYHIRFSFGIFRLNSIFNSRNEPLKLAYFQFFFIRCCLSFFLLRYSALYLMSL